MEIIIIIYTIVFLLVLYLSHSTTRATKFAITTSRNISILLTITTGIFLFKRIGKEEIQVFQILTLQFALCTFAFCNLQEWADFGMKTTQNRNIGIMTLIIAYLLPI